MQCLGTWNGALWTQSAAKRRWSEWCWSLQFENKRGWQGAETSCQPRVTVTNLSSVWLPPRLLVLQEPEPVQQSGSRQLRALPQPELIHASLPPQLALLQQVPRREVPHVSLLGHPAWLRPQELLRARQLHHDRDQGHQGRSRRSLGRTEAGPAGWYFRERDP